MHACVCVCLCVCVHVCVHACVCVDVHHIFVIHMQYKLTGLVKACKISKKEGLVIFIVFKSLRQQ